MKRNVQIYLLSDFTCETVCVVARSVFTQFQNLNVEESIWPLINSEKSIDRFFIHEKNNPGIVFFSLNDKKLNKYFIKKCRENNVTYLDVLTYFVSFIEKYLDVDRNSENLYGYNRDNYFDRINAIDFAIQHDDGQGMYSIEDADIIIIGPSRTSKTPTSIYLSYRGYKVANIPYVEGIGIPQNVINSNNFIVGLVISSEKLMNIRKNRLEALTDIKMDYTTYEYIENEIQSMKKICKKNNFLIIDVTERSVEETSSLIIKYYEKSKWGK